MAVIKNVHNNRVVFKEEELESACPIIHVTRKLSGGYNMISKPEADLILKSYIQGKPCIFHTTTEEHPEVNGYSTLVQVFLDGRTIAITLYDNTSNEFDPIYLAPID